MAPFHVCVDQTYGYAGHGLTRAFGLQLKTVYTDVPASVLYDVLHDPDYRRTWDKFMMEAEEIGYLNPNNSVSYYACECMHAPV